MQTEIFKALCGVLAEISPEQEIYIGEIPEDFARPSFLIEDAGSRYDPDHTAVTGENTLYLTIVVFGKLSLGYRSASQLEIMEQREKILEKFKDGRLSAGGRSIRVSASSGGESSGEVYIDLTLSWISDARMREETEPFMMEYHDRRE